MKFCWLSNVEFAAETHGEDSKEYRDAMNHPSTCMLRAGHAGDHRFTFDGDVRFFTRDGKILNVILPATEVAFNPRFIEKLKENGGLT